MMRCSSYSLPHPKKKQKNDPHPPDRAEPFPVDPLLLPSFSPSISPVSSCAVPLLTLLLLRHRLMNPRRVVDPIPRRRLLEWQPLVSPTRVKSRQPPVRSVRDNRRSWR